MDYLHKKIIIIGAGMAGVSLAIMLKNLGFNPVIFEELERDLLTSGVDQKSVNITISHRGVKMLKKIDCYLDLLNFSNKIIGRCHFRDNEKIFVPYSNATDNCLYSIDRKTLMKILIEQAENKGVEIKYGSKLKSINIPNQSCRYINKNSSHEENFDFMFGADGVYSKVRSTLSVPYKMEQPDFFYKKIEIDKGNAEKMRLDNESVNIVALPEGAFFTLPNIDGSHSGLLSMDSTLLAKLESHPREIKNVFKFLELNIDDFEDKFLSARAGAYKEVSCSMWYSNNCVLLLGDAVHAMLPFYAQGANSSFEDVDIFIEILEQNNLYLKEHHLNLKGLEWVQQKQYVSYRVVI